MVITTKYDVGDKVFTIMSPTMYNGGWRSIESKVMFIEIFYDKDKINIKYTFHGKAESRYEHSVYSSKEECDAKMGEIIANLNKE